MKGLHWGEVDELRHTYRFRSIGGSSTGAIAAALTAAAEYDRDGGGFDRLAQVRDRTTDELLQPRAAVRRLLQGLWLPVALGVVVTVLLVGYMVLGFNGELRGARAWAWPVLLLFVVFAAVAALAVAAALRAARLLRAALRDGTGMSTGMPERTYDNAAFTPWLHTTIQRVAGRRPGDAVLTFGDLRERGIDLQLMATDTRAGPVVLPASVSFAPEELVAFFPRDVVDHLRQHGSVGDDLPVVVAARVSAGVPGVLSAVPSSVDGEARWLCDGGLTGGLPVHHFDAWIPRRPTFGLGSSPRGNAFGAQLVHIVSAWQDKGDIRDFRSLDWESHRFDRYTQFMRALQTILTDEVDPAFRILEPELRDGPARSRAAARATAQLLDTVAKWGTAGRADFRSEVSD